jgi:hypothetical protein
MIHSHVRSRQPPREAWSRDRLLRERAIVLGLSIDLSTLNSYSSALNSYLNFVRLHDMPEEPTHDTLSFFTVFMSHQIEPRSVSNYLSGICQQLEPYFPNIRPARHTLERGGVTSRSRDLVDRLSRHVAVASPQSYHVAHSLRPAQDTCTLSNTLGCQDDERLSSSPEFSCQKKTRPHS